MASFSLIAVLFFVVLLFLSTSSSDAALIARQDVISHRPEAERLIHAFNLLPKDAYAHAHSHSGGADASAARLVEKQVRWPVLSDGGANVVDDYGHHAGYYKLPHSKDARMFYLFFESRNDKKKDPVVIWLTGGPGCSSQMALFYENGPFKISDDLSLVWNDFGWDKASNILFVDQPTGTGFSYTSDEQDIRHDEDGVSTDLYDFLQEFFKGHPEYAQNNFYVFGESYAGHYVPALASRIHQNNKDAEGIHINLKGFAIGNGLTNPEIQYLAYADYALDMKLIDKSAYEQINQTSPDCSQAAKSCGTNGTTSCMKALSVCQGIYESIMNIVGNINFYDIRKQCEGDLCYDFSNLERFLSEASVKKALGVGDIEFVSCSRSVYDAMTMDWMRNLDVGIPALLDDGIDLLVYAGEFDLICNWLGNSRWVNAMVWSGQKDFVPSPEVAFSVDGKEAGILKSHGPLSFLKVHDAGHMVPMDQPNAALEMVRRWINGTLSGSS